MGPNGIHTISFCLLFSPHGVRGLDFEPLKYPASHELPSALLELQPVFIFYDLRVSNATQQ